MRQYGRGAPPTRVTTLYYTVRNSCSAAGNFRDVEFGSERQAGGASHARYSMLAAGRRSLRIVKSAFGCGCAALCNDQ
jgi:hypothetical protein